MGYIWIGIIIVIQIMLWVNIWQYSKQEFKVGVSWGYLLGKFHDRPDSEFQDYTLKNKRYAEARQVVNELEADAAWKCALEDENDDA